MTKHSQFAQLVDSTGNAVGQQSIVINNMRKGSTDVLTAWKQAMAYQDLKQGHKDPRLQAQHDEPLRQQGVFQLLPSEGLSPEDGGGLCSQ